MNKSYDENVHVGILFGSINYSEAGIQLLKDCVSANCYLLSTFVVLLQK